MKVVESGYKIDLHIHSVYSRGKDHEKVSFNTLDNVDVLATKLDEQGVQMCAITDHDAFNYDIYKALKKYEEQDCSIVKVFPGVEFSVEFEAEEGNAIVHVIAIFNDEDETKLSNVENILRGDDGKASYDCANAFSEGKFLSILREIDLDTILIAHQKGSLSSKDSKKCDAKTVGAKRFQEFVHTDYFEAFEFKNKKNEIFNKNYIFTHGITEDLRFITGSDCHDWRVYPKENERDCSEFRYTYVKCLPTFRGLVMAVTDYRRIKTVNSYFNSAETFLPEIKLKVNGKEIVIPLSRGLNVIIGDNSIGKSLLLHKLTNYTKRTDKMLKAAVVTGYKKYLRDNKIQVLSKIEDNQIFEFDMQGEVRDKFEQGKINSNDFLQKYYPIKVNAESHKENIQRELNKVYSYLEEKFLLDDLENKLGAFSIVSADIGMAESLTFVGEVKQNIKEVGGLKKVSSDLITISEKVKSVQESDWIEEEDKMHLEKIKEGLLSISDKYQDKSKVVEIENHKIGLFQNTVKVFKQIYQKSVTDAQKQRSNYSENLERTIEQITELITRRKQNKIPEINVEKVNIDILTNHVFEYQFNSRLNVLSYDTEYVLDLFKAVFKTDVRKSVLDMSKQELTEAIPYYDGTSAGALEALRQHVEERVKGDFEPKFTIIQHGMDCTQELSSGFNSKIYFDLLSYETEREGIYLIDQPEDNISQKAIREYLLDRFKAMGERRQVIMVTHNPQFIVNLDVDNVIFLGKEENEIVVYSGALEYRDNEYNMLDIISTHIEGGLDTLKRRWKRYEKSNKVPSIG